MSLKRRSLLCHRNGTKASVCEGRAAGGPGRAKSDLVTPRSEPSKGFPSHRRASKLPATPTKPHLAPPSWSLRPHPSLRSWHPPGSSHTRLLSLAPPQPACPTWVLALGLLLSRTYSPDVPWLHLPVMLALLTRRPPFVTSFPHLIFFWHASQSKNQVVHLFPYLFVGSLFP